jgi:hypothetical protein
VPFVLRKAVLRRRAASFRQGKSARWEEGKHPRDHGKFASKPGAGAGPDENERTTPHAGPRERSPAVSDPGYTPDPEAGRATVNPDRPMSPEERRQILGKSPARRSDGLGGGCNETVLMELADGTMGVFKPARGEKPNMRQGVKAGTYWRREVAASEVADLLGFGDLVPTTTVRMTHHPEEPESEGWGDLATGEPTPAWDEPGSIQHYVAGAKEAADVGAEKRYDGATDAARAAAFDYLVGHLDRHEGNWLLSKGKLILIDNGLSFPTHYHIRDFFNMRFWRNAQLDRLGMPDLTGIRDKWPEVEKALQKSGLESEAIALTKQRFDALTSGKYQRLAQLPSLLESMPTLGAMTQRLQRPAPIKWGT